MQGTGRRRAGDPFVSDILLTGASGFVGREVARILLDHGHRVVALGRRAADDPRAEHVAADLLADLPDLAALGVTHLIHCAWFAEPGKFWGAAENCDWVAASIRLARAFAAAGGQRMIVAGTSAEYEWGDWLLTEDRLGGPPQTLYGQAKRSLFELLAAAAPVLGLSLGWGRIFVPYGAKDDPRRLLGTLIAARAEGRVAEFSAGGQVRDFIHVEDVAAALVALMESDASGAVNIGSGSGCSVRGLVEQAAVIAGYTDRVRFGALPPRPGEPASIVADTRRLISEVGFTPRYTLATGLAEALRHG